jgi:putative aldouronate transport system permease protein
MITLLVLDLGQILNVGFEKVILLYRSSTYETADIISTYVYRSGLISQQYSFAAAVGLFNSVVGLILIVASNNASKRIAQQSLW